MRRILTRLGIVFLAAFCSGLFAPAAAQSNPADAATLFAEANALYQEKQYAEAQDVYERILSAGRANASVYYNLGNTHFKQGHLGQAIANYLRAQRLSPRDPDVAENLRYARSLQVDQGFAPPARSFTARLLFGLRDRYTFNELAFTATALFWLFCLALASVFWKRDHSMLRSIAWILFFLYAIAAGITFAKHATLNRRSAVVISPKISVTSGPDAGTELFTLHEGTTAVVQRDHGSWVQITLPNGLSGWARRSDLEFL